MRYKIISAILGASLVAAAVSGCGNSNKTETEAPSISLDGIEIVGESESETESEEGTEEILPADESEPETLELDLYKKPSGMIEEDETEENGLLVESENESESESSGSALVQTDENQMKPQGIGEEPESSATVEETELAEGLGTYQAATKETPAVSEKETERLNHNTETEKAENKSQKADETESTKDKSTEKTVKPAETETAGRKKKESGKKETSVSTEKETSGEKTEPKKKAEQNKNTGKEQTEKSETAVPQNTQNADPQKATEKESEIKTEPDRKTGLATEAESETEITAETESEDETEVFTETEPDSETEPMTEADILNLKIVADRVNVRQRPSTDAEIQNLVTMGARVIVLEQESGGWSKIKYESEHGLEEGYIRSEYLLAPDRLRTVDEKIRIRKEPGIEEEQIGQLEPQDEILILSEDEKEWTEILFNTEEKKVLRGYVKTEFLKEVDILKLNENIVAEYKRLLEADGLSSGNRPEEGSTEESESEIETENTSENQHETETEDTPESETDTETEDAPESESDAETEDTSENESDAETEDTSESESDAETEDTSESESDAETEDTSESRSGTEAENTRESESEIESENTAGRDTEAELASENKSDVESHSVPEWPTETVDAQIYAAQQLIPGVSHVGIIYTEGDKDSEALAKRYLEKASQEGIEVSEATIIDELDVDLAASELAGKVEGILCLDDETMNGLVESVAAYADEVGIPVIGFEEEQVAMGCAAAVDHGTLYFSQKELDRLGISLNFDPDNDEER